jgi:hypothetical protein
VRTEGIRKGRRKETALGEVECLSGGEKKRVKKDRRVEFGLLGAPCRDSLILVRYPLSRSPCLLGLLGKNRENYRKKVRRTEYIYFILFVSLFFRLPWHRTRSFSKPVKSWSTTLVGPAAQKYIWR